MKLYEAITHTQYNIDTNKDSFKENFHSLISNLKAANFQIAIKLERNEDVLYIGKLMGIRDEEFEDLVERMTMDKDFQERAKAKSLFEKKYLTKIKSWLIQHILDYTYARTERFGKNSLGDTIIEFLNKTNIKNPYIKFIKPANGGLWRLVSFHDSEKAFEKKSYNDTQSYRLGSKSVRDLIRKQMKNN